MLYLCCYLRCSGNGVNRYWLAHLGSHPFPTGGDMTRSSPSLPLIVLQVSFSGTMFDEQIPPQINDDEQEVVSTVRWLTVVDTPESANRCLRNVNPSSFASK